MFFFILVLFTDVIEGGADNYAHFNISRWIFRHPYLVFDLWGKPVFTILSAPFAQFGLNGVRVFNIICGLITAWYCYKTSLIFNLKHSWLTIVFVILTPIYLVMITSGMTEILFSLILVMAVYYFFKEKYILSSVILSFLFLIRIEGLAFEILFLAAFLIKRKNTAIPFLATGFLFFSIVGSLFQFHDFWWLIHNRPYARGGPSVYGSGSIWHYFYTMPSYFGYVVMFFLLSGTIFLIVQWKKEHFRMESLSFMTILLVAGCLYGYLAIHSYLWWKGETSVGLLRVMAGVSPLAAILSMAGFSELIKFIKIEPIRKFGAPVVFLLLVVLGARFYHSMTSQVDLSAELLERVTNWLKASGNLSHRVVVHDPYFAYSTGLDPWDSNRIQFGFSSNEFPESGLPDSSVFIWDAHFSANEGKMSLEKISSNRNFQLVKKFEPKDRFTVLGGFEYKILVFRKVASVPQEGIQGEMKQDSGVTGNLYRAGYNFETATGDANIDGRIESGNPKNSSRYYKLGADMEFGPGFVLNASNLKLIPESVFKVSTDFFADQLIEPKQVLIVFSVEKNNNSVHYATFDFGENPGKPGDWNHSEHEFSVPADIGNWSTVKIYVWNIGKRQLLLDNLLLEVSE